MATHKKYPDELRKRYLQPHVAEFVVWLQLPTAGRAGEVAVLSSSVPEVTVATVNRKLAAVSVFYVYQARPATMKAPGTCWPCGGRRAGRLEAVPPPRQQGKALSRQGDHAEGAEDAAADPPEATLLPVARRETRQGHSRIAAPRGITRLETAH